MIAPGVLPPLSPLQKQFWLLEQLNPEQGMFNICCALRIDGPLNVASLERALRAVAQRHALLTTVFSTGADGMPGLAPYDCVLPPLVPRVVPAGTWRDAAVAAALVPFALENGLLWRALLFSEGDACAHVLVLVLHHAIGDGRSLEILGEDLRLSYGAAVANEPPRWPPAPAPYAQIAQREDARPPDDPALAAPLAFWRAELDGIAAHTPLPPDLSRPAVARHVKHGVRAALSGADFGRLIRFVRERRVTPFAVVAAATAKALAIVAGRSQTLIVTPVANRTGQSTARTVGPFAEMCLMRVRAARAPFAQVLAEVRRSSIAVLEHTVALDRLIAALAVGRVPGRRSLFDAVLTLRRAAPPAAAGGVTWTSEEFDLPVAPFDLGFDFVQRRDELGLTLVYDGDVYAARTGELLCAATLDALHEAIASC